MSVPKLQVDVWSDVACPWCWVGILRYKQAVAKIANRAKVTTKFHAYMIDPATKREGAQFSPHLPARILYAGLSFRFVF